MLQRKKITTVRSPSDTGDMPHSWGFLNRYIRLLGCMIAVPLLAFLLVMTISPAGHARAAVGGTQQVWAQVMDSCQQAISGATFQVVGANQPAVAAQAAAPGLRHTVASAHGLCPLQRGNCTAVAIGCQAWTLAIPATGTTTYTVREVSSPAAYVPCTGGSVCPGGPEVATINVDSTGKVSATIHNIYPNGASVIWPTSGAPYAGTTTDPLVFHDFGLGNISCDGDGDADDHLTGSPSSHCRNYLDPANGITAPGAKPAAAIAPAKRVVVPAKKGVAPAKAVKTARPVTPAKPAAPAKKVATPAKTVAPMKKVVAPAKVVKTARPATAATPVMSARSVVVPAKPATPAKTMMPAKKVAVLAKPATPAKVVVPAKKVVAATKPVVAVRKSVAPAKPVMFAKPAVPTNVVTPAKPAVPAKVVAPVKKAVAVAKPAMAPKKVVTPAKSVVAIKKVVKPAKKVVVAARPAPAGGTVAPLLH